MKPMPAKEVKEKTIYDLMLATALFRAGKGGKPAWRKLKALAKARKAA
jgi:hypothetical protein